MSGKNTAITKLLSSYQQGNGEALDELLPLVYDELRRIAGGILKQRQRGRTLVPTVLVHEAFVRLVENKALILKDRTHFFSVAARCMRFILADYARARTAKKRGGEARVVTFLEEKHGEENRTVDLLVLDRALTKLGHTYPELVQVVELRYLAGLSIQETATALNSTPAVVRRQWDLAKAWLMRELGEK